MRKFLDQLPGLTVGALVGLLLLVGGAYTVMHYFQTARDQARTSSCQSNLRQLALGLRAYAADYDACLPPGSGMGLPGDPEFGWAGTMQPYTKSWSILQCPGETTSMNSTTTTGSPEFLDYWMNSRLGGTALTRVTFPAFTLMLGDGAPAPADSMLSDAVGPWRSRAPYARRHMGGACYVFVDGRAAHLMPTQIKPSAPAGSNAITFRP